MAVQTSNAMFIHTDQIDQQFAISRLRAIETGRYVVVAAINGVSGVIAPDGGVVDRAGVRTRRARRAGSGSTTRSRRRSGSGRGSDGSRVAWPGLGVAAGSACQYRRSRTGSVTESRPGPPGVCHRRHDDEGDPVSIDGRSGRVVMVIPTYNEADNLAWIVGRLRAAQPDVDVLVVDDSSPDGTGEIADELAAADPAGPGAAPHREGRPRRGVPARLPRRARRPATT